MKTTPGTITLVTALLLSALMVAGAYAMTVTPGSGSVQVGSTTTIPIILDQSPNNLGYANISVSISDPSVAQIVAISFPPFPSWIHYPLDNSSFPVGSMFFKEMTLSTSSYLPAETNLNLGTLTLQGLKPGTVSINVNKAAIQYVTDTIVTVYPDGGSGSLQVTATPTPTPTTTEPTTTATTAVTTPPTTEPTTTTTTTVTTQPTTTETTVVTTQPTTEPTTQPTTPVTTLPTTEPTTIPPSGPTGSVYLSTTPSGADIFIDGSSSSSGTTPAIIILSVGTHHASLRLGGYKDVPIYFEVEQDMTTIIAPRTLVPGIGTMPTIADPSLTVTTFPTTVVTTIPSTPVVTPPPSEGLFGWFDPAKLIQRLTAFGSTYF
ncbi:MAG TPA: hypothetical protein VMS89_05840 [Methanoregulaceae archaeon]|nr:hypothetical protein [Methanoregulaceae archaeon]